MDLLTTYLADSNLGVKGASSMLLRGVGRCEEQKESAESGHDPSGAIELPGLDVSQLKRARSQG